MWEGRAWWGDLAYKVYKTIPSIRGEQSMVGRFGLQGIKLIPSLVWVLSLNLEMSLGMVFHNYLRRKVNYRTLFGLKIWKIRGGG